MSMHTVDELELRLPNSFHLPPTDPDSPLLPTNATGTPLDFHTPRVIGSTRLDTAYAQLTRGTAGRAAGELSNRRAGRAVRLWVDASFPYLMVYTGDQVDRADRRRLAVPSNP